MSDSKGSHHPPGENSTRFLDVELNFGCREGSSKISTRQFLEDSKCIVGIFEKMGKVFAPLKYDMTGNITKITSKYSSNEEAHEFLDEMILAEKAEGGNVTTDALQWLRRGLHFIARFFECIIEDADAGSDRQDLKPFFRTAYQEVLERYHGWMGVKLFNVMCRFAPSRKELFRILSSGKTCKDELILQDIRVFKTNLLTCVRLLITFYNDHDLENHAKV